MSALPQCCRDGAYGWTATEVSGQRKAVSIGLTICYGPKVSGGAVAKTVNRLVRIRNERDRHARIPQPCEDVAVERIAVLSLVDDDFGETCGKGAAHGGGPVVSAQPLHNFDPNVSSAEIPASMQTSAPTGGCALISRLMAGDVLAQRQHADHRRVDAIVGSTEQVEAGCFARECERASQPYLDAQRVPAVDHDRLHIDTLHAPGSEEEVSQEPVKRANEVRKSQNRLKGVLAAALGKFVDRRIRKRQHGNAATVPERRRDPRHTRDDGPRLSSAGTSLDECTTGMPCNGALLRRQVHASLTLTMA